MLLLTILFTILMCRYWLISGDKAKICKLNTDDARDSAMNFGISAIPTLILFKDSQVQKKWVGLTSKKNLAAAIDELL